MRKYGSIKYIKCKNFATFFFQKIQTRISRKIFKKIVNIITKSKLKFDFKKYLTPFRITYYILLWRSFSKRRIACIVELKWKLAITWMPESKSSMYMSKLNFSTDLPNFLTFSRFIWLQGIWRQKIKSQELLFCIRSAKKASTAKWNS